MDQVDPELFGQELAEVPEGLERLGLPAGPVQGEHQLSAQALAERVLEHQGLQLADEVDVAAELEVNLDPLLERRHASRVQAGRLHHAQALGGEVGQRWAAPQGQRCAQPTRGRLQGARSASPTCLCDLHFEAVQVALAGPKP
jgi:hypothetical protein